MSQENRPPGTRGVKMGNDYNKLNKEEEMVIVNKGTEKPYSGEYNDFFEKGIYVCRRCNKPLYKSDSKFHSGCGWPSFDQEINGNVKRIPDPDGSRTEIICTNCRAHLGHVFTGEGLTNKNTRHCVNSLSIKFIKRRSINNKIETAIFGTGCFWCSEAIFKEVKGIISVTPGYAGGDSENPTYEKVCNEIGNYAEVVKIEFDPEIISYNKLLEMFWEIHDPTSLNKQSNDEGVQYRSIIIYTSDIQKDIIHTELQKFNNSGSLKNKIVTEIKPYETFYNAEDYHIEYYSRNKYNSYCSMVISPKIIHFKDKFKDFLI